MREMSSVAETLVPPDDEASTSKVKDSAPDPSSSSTPSASTSTGNGTTTGEPGAAYARTRPLLDSRLPFPEPKPSRLTVIPHSSSSSSSSEKDHNSQQPSRSNSPKEKDSAGKRRNPVKMTPEQRKKLDEIQIERRKAMDERVATLTTQLVERLRPYVEAKRPGEKDDPETIAFEAKMRREADDLKLESFGVEVRGVVDVVHLFFLVLDTNDGFGTAFACDWERVHGQSHVVLQVAQVFGDVRAFSFSLSFLLICSDYLSSPGFFSRLKEKGSIAKDAWGVIGSAYVVILLVLVGCPSTLFFNQTGRPADDVGE